MKTQTKSRLSRPGQPSGQTNAFTLVELLVVILTIAILTALLLPALASTGIKDQEIQCLTNVKQLQIAWTSYAGDNNGKLAQNIAGFVAGGGFATSGRQANAQPGQQYAGWVLGDVENADPNLITHGLIYQYVGNPAFYRCPMDTKTNTAGQPALRTYSMNCWMNGIPNYSSYKGLNPTLTDFTNLTGINSKMPPAQALVFIEESPASINDGYWVQNIDNPTMWVDDPAFYHVNSGCMSFADGHCQTRKWTDRYILSGEWNSSMGFPCDPTSSDLAWVQARCTVPSH